MKTFDNELLSTISYLGIRFDGNGYKYIQAYQHKLFEENSCMCAAEIIQKIAIQFRATVYGVQSSLRLCIENATRFGLGEKLNALFGYTVSDSRPSVKLTLNLIHEYLRIYRGFESGKLNE